MRGTSAKNLPLPKKPEVQSPHHQKGGPIAPRLLRPLPHALLACLLLASVAARAADAPATTRPTFSPAWLTATADNPTVHSLFEKRDPTALSSLADLLDRDLAARLRFSRLDDDLAARLIRDLDRLEQSDSHAFRTDAVHLVDLLGPRRPDAVPFLLRTSTIDQQHPDLPPRGYPVAIDALAHPANDPALLSALVNAATEPDARIATAALAYIEPSHYPAIAQALGTVIARNAMLGRYDFARVPDLLADCRADSPTLRETAARQLHESGLFPQPLTAALLRAVTNRDMPAREGLLRALEQAHAAQSDPLANLQQAAASDDSATRAYAKAALRDLDPAHQP